MAAGAPDAVTNVGFSVGVGLVLLVAGAAKLRQPEWPATARAFGLPRWASALLPWAEVAVGAMLVTGVGMPFTALAAAALVAGFTGMVALRLVLGQPAPCGCFGETSPRPIGTATLVRNLILLGAAAGAVLTAGEGGGPVAAAAGVAGAAVFLLLGRSRAAAPH
ncbi:MAG TPA: MauE/DoxX family redox-associated membrane protein [Acidimicrobiales bacterium]|nr:MauE/DoxX family redox-associated membrane protein [Acidimicrobiales bacterium]